MTQVEPSRNNRDDVRVQSDGFKFFDRQEKPKTSPASEGEKALKFAQDLLGIFLLAFGAVLLLGVLGLTKGGFISPLVLILKQQFWHW